VLPGHLVEAAILEIVERLLDPPTGDPDPGIGGCGQLGIGKEFREPLDGSLHVVGVCEVGAAGGAGVQGGLGGWGEEAIRRQLAAGRKQPKCKIEKPQ